MLTYVLDTNVLLYDPEAIFKFPNHKIVLPIVVLEELDRVKRYPNELGKNSRGVLRQLNFLRELSKSNWQDGVKLENGATIAISTETASERVPVRTNKVLMAAHALHKKGSGIVFVSKDFAARIKAESLGIQVEDYEYLKVSYDDLYRGIAKLDVTKREVDTFYKDETFSPPENNLNSNEYVILKSPESSAVGRYNAVKGEIEPLVVAGGDIWGVKPRNMQQQCVIDALLRDDIKLVTLVGPAGTGKTLLALACGLRKVFDEGTYRRILVSRPIMPLGRDIGYLPGTKEEKLQSWMQPIFDNLDFLCGGFGGEGSSTLEWVLESDKIEMEAVTYIRGRSLPKMYIIIDEAQNLTPHEVKTIISRAGEGTKVILAGDPTQIDNPYLDKDSNGLTFTVGKFWDQKIFSHIFLDKTERSELAAIAAEIM